MLGASPFPARFHRLWFLAATAATATLRQGRLELSAAERCQGVQIRLLSLKFARAAAAATSDRKLNI